MKSKLLKHIHFKGLTQIRALAALSVLFHHIELNKFREGKFSLFETDLNYIIGALGKKGVFVFFVLSGFLITYLLLVERANFSKVNIKKFYLRRVLRIWPLYYLTVLLSFVFLPLLVNNFDIFQNTLPYTSLVLKLNDNYWVVLLLFILFLPNFALKLKPAVAGASQSWSVGVEEQFYLIWPHLFNLIKKPLILLFTFLLIVALPILSPYLFKLVPSISLAIEKFFHFIPINYMAIGAVGAYFKFYHSELVNKLTSKPILFIICIVLFFLSIYLSVRSLYFSVLTIALILFIIQPKYKYNLRNKYLEKIGNISYGVYMFHPIIMYICFSFTNYYLPNIDGVLYNFIIYSTITTLTLLTSYYSYHYFEKRFILLKDKKYSTIKK